MTEAARKLGEQQAYPVAIETPTAEVNFGLTKREAFAMAAMQGILSANAAAMDEVNDKNVDAVVAREAVASAGALLEALTTEPTKDEL